MKLEQVMPLADNWKPYTPDDKSPWNLRRVVHLHRRAGFAATWNEIQRDLKDGPKASIDRVLNGKAATEGVPEKFEEIADVTLGPSAAASRDPARLKAWWVYRMMFGPDPLTERLALMWHNHFASSNLKVENLTYMRGQNELFRKLGRKHFGELLNAVARDPATLMWLDAPANRKGQPNENLARELMELFSMGIGNYTEADVKDAARALTGWTIEEREIEKGNEKVIEQVFVEVLTRHDDDEKTILGKKGKWKGADLVKMVLEHPATSKRIAGRICELLLGEKARKSADIDGLANGLHERDLDIAWAVETVLRSRLFFADENIGNRVLGPVEYVIGAARALELFDPPSSTLVLAEWCGRLGQDLFYPPNVGGWPGGRSWLTTRAVVGRANYAAALVDGILVGRKGPMDALAVAKQHGQDDIVAFYTRLLFGIEPTEEWRQRINGATGGKANDEGERARKVVGLILATPEAQLA
jgi:uncharacterized protein (DUF1800 family)